MYGLWKLLTQQDQPLPKKQEKRRKERRTCAGICTLCYLAREPDMPLWSISPFLGGGGMNFCKAQR